MRKQYFFATNGIEWAHGIWKIIEALENSDPVNFHEQTSLSAALGIVATLCYFLNLRKIQSENWQDVSDIESGVKLRAVLCLYMYV